MGYSCGEGVVSDAFGRLESFGGLLVEVFWEAG